ncbi:helix-turn-helix domain-containing protein [Aliarcobacter skirrowii]|uniref:helix-turn-helix domain-containing protein n=1 Tax=Aliarcobacter skirrowii TaxID=28200 RepID=UPI0021B4440B|nr:helix-turn-helix transcriptional regulator [Aliarcobacter skirrowii]MCT7446744.1 helix-turn-helix domain-containing protein [Aliarcobacter skirrowii]
MARKIKQIDYPILDGEITAEYLGKFVKAKRTKSNLTSHQTALLCNVPVDVITKLENSRGGITLESFLKVINGLSINMSLKEDKE